MLKAIYKQLQDMFRAQLRMEKQFDRLLTLNEQMAADLHKLAADPEPEVTGINVTPNPPTDH